MQAMTHPKFEWGKKKGVGGPNKDVQIYESFIYDGVEYFLYDSVYLYVEDEPEPYIGKLVKIWEQPNKKKRVKVVWFFRPIELLNWLGDDVILKNEIFLAAGKGVGLANVNPLEVLVGKCNVVCTSKDKRNPQPSEEELKMADYIFYRTFDVGTFTISDKIEETINGIDVRYFLNRKQGQNFIPVPKLYTNWKDQNGKLDLSSKLDSMEAVSHIVKDGKPGFVTGQVAKGEELRKPPASRDAQGFFLGEKTISQPKRTYKDGVKAGKAPIGQVEDNAKLQSVKGLFLPDAFGNTSFNKQSFLCDLAKLPEEVEPNVSPLALGKKINTIIVHELRISSNDDIGKSSGSPLRTSEQEAKPRPLRDFDGQDRGLTKKVVNPSEKVTKLSDKAGCGLPPQKGVKSDGQVLEVTQKPFNADRSKWFKIPWECRMKQAYEKGALVLFQNLDPSYTSAEVEDIVWDAFREKCTAKLIPRNLFSSPHNGQSFVIFKSTEVAEMVIAKLHNGCLMLPNGRPLVARKRTPNVPLLPTKFVGHLSIGQNKLRNQQSEMRNAVSTSHFPQPNTIEYGMAVEWSLLCKKSGLWWEALYEQHGKALDDLKGQLNPR